MRKVVTYIECDRCTFNQIVECKKNFFGYKMSQYPEDWKMMENNSLCPKCKKQWYGEYKKFMNKGKGKEGE